MKPLDEKPKLTNFFYEIYGIELYCDIEYEKGERETRYEPGEPDNATAHAVRVNGIDIIKILSTDVILEIEVAFLNQGREY